MKCPRCVRDLEPEVYEGVEIDRCGACKGTWLDADEVPKIINARGEKFGSQLVQETLATAFRGVPQDEQRSVERCPKCEGAMVALNYDLSSGVVVDRCPQGHGLWMDGRELEKVQVHREHWEKEYERNRDDWVGLVRSVEEGRRDAADENRRRGMRPTKYLINTVIRKLLGN